MIWQHRVLSAKFNGLCVWTHQIWILSFYFSVEQKKRDKLTAILLQRNESKQEYIYIAGGKNPIKNPKENMIKNRKKL